MPFNDIISPILYKTNRKQVIACIAMMFMGKYMNFEYFILMVKEYLKVEDEFGIGT